MYHFNLLKELHGWTSDNFYYYCYLLMTISAHSLLITVPRSLLQGLSPLSSDFQGTGTKAKESCKTFSLEGHILAWNLFQAELTRDLAHLYFGSWWCCPSGSWWQV